MESKDVKGVRSTKEPATPVRVMPYRPENGRMSRDEFIAWRQKEKKAALKGEQARQEALSEDAGMDVPAADESKINTLRAKLADIEKKLIKKPGDTKLTKERNKIAEELDRAEG